MSKTIFGMPVSGDAGEPTDPVQQRPLSDLEPVFRALIEDPNVHSFGWTQYTPYFNDGDTCEFSVNEPWLRTVDDVAAEADAEEGQDDYDFEIGDTHPTLGNKVDVRFELSAEELAEAKARYRAKGWHESYVRTHEYRCVDREAKYPETLERAKKLSDIQAYELECAMRQAFGDHARVTVTKDGITIDEHSHD